MGRFTDGQKPPTFWYFVHDGARDGHGYFVGYDSQSKRRVGFVGRDGFRTDRPPVEQSFPVDSAKLGSGRAFSQYITTYGYDRYSGRDSDEFPVWKADMISGAEVLEVDLRSGSVRTLMESADLISVGFLGFSLTQPSLRLTSQTIGEMESLLKLREKLAIRTSDRVVVFDAARKQSAVFLLPEEFRDRGINFYELEEGALLTSTREIPHRGPHVELAWIDPSGKVLRRAEVSLHENYRADDASEVWTAVLAVPVPVLVAWETTGFWFPPDYPTALAYYFALYWPALLVVTLFSAALAWYCYRRHRRYYQPAGGVWFAFVLLLGLPGLVGYLFHRRWPVLEKCPACGQVVPRDREACAKCGAAFPPPEPKGWEVFA